MDALGEIAVLVPFWVDRGANDTVLLLLLGLLLIPAIMGVWIDSLLARSVDALIYDRGHIFFRKLRQRISVILYVLLGGVQRHLLVGITGYLLLRERVGVVTETAWSTITLVLLLALSSCSLSLLYIGVNRLLAYIYLDEAFYQHWWRHYSILEWLWPVPLYVSSLMLLVGSGYRVALWWTVAILLVWRVAIILPTIVWLRATGGTPLLISLYLCSQELAPLVYLIGFGMLLL